MGRLTPPRLRYLLVTPLSDRAALGSHRPAPRLELRPGLLFGVAVSGNDLGGSIAVSTASPGVGAWLTGGTFGPEASVLALLLVTR